MVNEAEVERISSANSSLPFTVISKVGPSSFLQLVRQVAKAITPTIGVEGVVNGPGMSIAGATAAGTTVSSNTTINVDATGLNAEEAYAVIAMHARRANSGWGGDL